jgi:general secretion pathway protein F
MEQTGLPAGKAFSLLKLPGDQKQLIETRKLQSRGMDIATAGAKSGLFTLLESRLLCAALTAGSPVSTYQRLASTYAAKAQQTAAIRSRMVMPTLVFVIALLVQPLSALVAGSLSMGAYVWHILQPLFALTGLYFFVAWLSRWHTLLLRVPLFGPMHLRHNVADFVHSLALLLEAGVPMFDALPEAVSSVDNGIIRNRFAAIKAHMVKGVTLADALASVLALLEYPGSDQLIAFIQSGEASGKLPEMLQRMADSETAAVQNFQQQTTIWLPRLIYGCVALWVGYGMVTGNAFMLQVPQALR